MKSFTLILYLLVSSKVFAPGNNFVPVIAPEPINPYLPILNACIEVESKGNRFAYNPIEQSTGILQIRPIRLQDYNIRTGSNYKLSDCFDPDVSIKIFMFYVSKCDYRDIKGMAIAWNGKSKENKYYSKVKKLL